MKRELEKRLIKFSVDIYHLCESLKKTEFSLILSSVALNYGEARGAETKKDFIHKIGIVLKELRESYVNLRIINDVSICKGQNKMDVLIRENNELISIFFTTLKTAKLSEKSKN